MFESKGYWIAIRQTAHGEYADPETMDICKGIIPGKIKREEQLCPRWSAANPVIRIVRVEIKEMAE